MPTGQKTIIWTAANDERLLLSILAVHNVTVDSATVAKVFGKTALSVSYYNVVISPSYMTLLWSQRQVHYPLHLASTYTDLQSGNDITASVIQTRMKKLKAKARALNPGVTANDALVAPSTAKRSRATTKTNSGAMNKKVKTEPPKIDENKVDDFVGTPASAANDHTVTPPATPSKKTTRQTTEPTTPAPKAGSGAINGHVRAQRCSPRDCAKPDYAKLNDPFVHMEAGITDDGTNVFSQATDAASESEDSIGSDHDFETEGIPA